YENTVGGFDGGFNDELLLGGWGHLGSRFALSSDSLTTSVTGPEWPRSHRITSRPRSAYRTRSASIVIHRLIRAFLWSTRRLCPPLPSVPATPVHIPAVPSPFAT